MRALPETATRRAGTRGTFVVLVVAACAVVFVAAALITLSFGGQEAGGEELISPVVRDVAASAEETAFPSRDEGRFGEGTEEVFVYLSVRGLDPESDLSATVGRSGRSSLLGRFFGGRRLSLQDADEEQLRPDGDGVSGVVRFEVRARGGGALPPGDYEVTALVDGEAAAVEGFSVAAG